MHQQCGRPGFNPWIGKFPWRRERLPTPVFWPREFHELCSPWGCKDLDTTEKLSLSILSSLVVQMVKCLPAMWEICVWSLGWEDTLEKEMTTHSSTLAWTIPWMEEPHRLQSMRSQRVRHDWATSLSLIFVNFPYIAFFLIYLFPHLIFLPILTVLCWLRSWKLLITHAGKEERLKWSTIKLAHCFLFEWGSL